VFCLELFLQEYRDAFLAEVCGFLFMDDGESDVSNTEELDFVRGGKIPYMKVRRGVKFADTDGLVRFLEIGCGTASQ